MKIKKTLIGIILASNLYAGGMGPIKTGFDVYAPNVSKSNELTGGAVFLRPNGNQDYAVLTNPFGPTALTPSWQVLDVNTSFSPGFFFNLRHTFDNTSNDINLYWLHLRTSNSTSNQANGSTTPYPGWQMIGPDYEIGPNDKFFRSGFGSVNYSFDAINGDLGQHIHIDPLLKTRLFAGISGVILQNTLSGTFSGLEINTNTQALYGFVNFPQSSISKYNGAGIRVGLDAESNPCFNHFSFLGGFASSLLIGTQYSRTTFTGSSTSLQAAGIAVNDQFIAKKSYANLVPAFDGKLGLKYAYQYNDKTFTIEGGYMAAIYINAIVNYVPATTVPPSASTTTGGIYLQSLKKTIDNFSFNGPYVNASLKM